MKAKTALLKSAYYLRLTLNTLKEGPVRVHPFEDRIESNLLGIESLIREFDNNCYAEFTRK